MTRLIQEADQDWGAAWNDKPMGRIKDELGQIIRLMRQRGIGLLVVLFPVDAQVYARVDTPLGLEWPQRELAATADGAGVAVLDLLPVLREHRQADLFHDQAHLRPATHHLVADAILRALDEHQLIPP